MLTKAWEVGATAGFFGYGVLYMFSRLVMPHIPGINTHYLALKPGGRAEWDSRVPSCVHAVMIVLGVYYCALFSHEHMYYRVAYYDDRLFVPYGATGLGPEFFMALFVGYLGGDLVLLLVYRNQMEMFELMLTHHLFAGLCWVVAIGSQTMQWYACFLMLSEFSTPVSNLRWWMAKSCATPTSVIYLLVCSGFFVTFFMARIMCLPVVIYLFIRYDAAKVQAQFHWKETSLWSLALVVHCMLQSYWFALMSKAVLSKILGWDVMEEEGLRQAEEEERRKSIESVETGIGIVSDKAKRLSSASTGSVRSAGSQLLMD